MKASTQYQYGRTLIELMIALTIGLIISGALVVLFLSSQITSIQTNDKTKLTQDGTYALYVIGQLIRNAGYGEIISSKASGDAAKNLTLPVIHGCDGGYQTTSSVKVPITTSTTCASASPTASDGITLSQLVEPVNCLPLGTASVAGIPTYESNNNWGGDILGQCVQAEVNARGQAVSQVSHRLMVATPNATAGNLTPAPALYVRSSVGNPTSGGGGPILSGAMIQPLIDNVEQMRIRYVMSDSDNNPEGYRYLNAGINEMVWSRVVGVSVCLLMSTENKGTSINTASNNSYVDCDGTVRTGTDTKLRDTFRGFYGLRNRMTPVSHTGV